MRSVMIKTTSCNITTKPLTGEIVMDSMQEFWACQWLLNNIGETHKTQEILKAIEIAKTEGYIRRDGHLTAAGKSYVEQNREVFSLVE